VTDATPDETALVSGAMEDGTTDELAMARELTTPAPERRRTSTRRTLQI